MECISSSPVYRPFGHVFQTCFFYPCIKAKFAELEGSKNLEITTVINQLLIFLKDQTATKLVPYIYINKSSDLAAEMIEKSKRDGSFEKSEDWMNEKYRRKSCFTMITNKSNGNINNSICLANRRKWQLGTAHVSNCIDRGSCEQVL